MDALFRDLLIGVTSFFRDPETFESIIQYILPRIINERAPDAPLAGRERRHSIFDLW